MDPYFICVLEIGKFQDGCQTFQFICFANLIWQFFPNEDGIYLFMSIANI
jgi:hypothetical protein